MLSLRGPHDQLGCELRKLAFGRGQQLVELGEKFSVENRKDGIQRVRFLSDNFVGMGGMQQIAHRKCEEGKVREAGGELVQDLPPTWGIGQQLNPLRPLQVLGI